MSTGLCPILYSILNLYVMFSMFFLLCGLSGMQTLLLMRFVNGQPIWILLASVTPDALEFFVSPK